VAGYEFLLLGHIVAAIVWLGAGSMMLAQATRADRERDYATLKKIFEDASRLSSRIFLPSALAVLIFGILLVLDSPWSFGDLWIVLGLAGFGATFVTGLFLSKPRADRIAALMEREGGMTSDVAAETRKLFTIARIDYVVLFLVVAVMVAKPTADDVGLLVALAAILAAAVAYTVWQARSVGEAPRRARAGETA
jgi:uncharacterized membrane protein